MKNSLQVISNLRAAADQLESLENHELDQQRNNRKVGHIETLVFDQASTAKAPEYHHKRGFKSFVIREASTKNTTVKVCFNRDFSNVFQYKANSVFNSPFPISEAVFFGDDQSGEELTIEIYDYAVVSTGSINEVKAISGSATNAKEPYRDGTLTLSAVTELCADISETHSLREAAIRIDGDAYLSYDSDMTNGFAVAAGETIYHDSLVGLYAYDYTGSEPYFEVLETRRAL